MAKVISIGNQSFESIREKDNFYIDKTNFIREWWDNDDTVTLITRPRRFGKTLNMSMLRSFLNLEQSWREFIGKIFMNFRRTVSGSLLLML